MLSEKAVYYHSKGYNCSSCILRAAEDEYKIKIENQCYKLCTCINNGFGVGSICSTLVACIMLFGILFDEYRAKKARIRLLSEFSTRYKSLNCSEIKKNFDKKYTCNDLISEIADLAENIINENL